MINARLKQALDKWLCPLFVVCLRLFRSLHFEKKETEVEIKSSAWVRFEPPTLDRKSLNFHLGHEEQGDFGWSKSFFLLLLLGLGACRTYKSQ